jgi:hypothetical protein
MTPSSGAKYQQCHNTRLMSHSRHWPYLRAGAPNRQPECVLPSQDCVDEEHVPSCIDRSQQCLLLLTGGTFESAGCDMARLMLRLMHPG